MPQVDLERYPTLHISRALQGIPDGKERDYLFGQIRKELQRRRRVQRQQQINKDKKYDAALREAKQIMLMEDAAKHEARINPRERNRDEDEN